MKYLITGGCGFLGTNLAEEVLKRQGTLYLFDNLSRIGTYDNLQWLKNKGRFDFFDGDSRNTNDVERAIQEAKPDVIFHLAGQVAMTTSLNNPRLDFETNVLGGINVLETVRKYCPDTVIVYSSTNKVYGDLENIQYDETATRYVAPDFPNGFSENLPLNFQSPYGCSKGTVDQYMLDYAKIFGLNTIVFRHSSIYGGRQFSTFDQGWVGWFVQQALNAQQGNADPFTISGNGKQVRDLLYVSDLVNCYFSAVDAIEKSRGQVFNMGGGMKNSLSLLELFSILENELSVKLHYRTLPWRESDQKIFVADTEKAQRTFNWAPKTDALTGIRCSIKWTKHHE